MIPSLLDTDTLSEILKGRNRPIAEKATEYLAQFGSLAFSLITRYEILRGLRARHAAAQLSRFNSQCERSRVLPISDEIVVKAADLYAELRARGALISDADLFIAATAMQHGLTLVTNNLDHFRRISGLAVQSWAE